MRTTLFGLLLVVIVISLVLLATASIGVAQQDNFSVQWKDIAVADALAALQRQFGIQYVLASDLGSKRVTLSLTDVSPTEAMRQILSAANLTAVNENGVWRIRGKAQAVERTYRGGMSAATAVAATPAPYRRAPPGVNVGGALGTAAGYGATAAPSLGMPGMTGYGQGMQVMQQYSPEDFVFRIIPLKFVDPYIILEMFGGNAVGGQRGGGEYGGSRGGYDSGRGYDRYDRDSSDRYDRDSSDRYDRDRSSRDRYSRDRYYD